MSTSTLSDALQDGLSRLVHPAGRADRLTAALHATFIGSRFAIGVGALAVVPVLVATRSALAQDAIIVAAALLVIVAGIVTSRTGLLDLGCGLTSAAICVFALALGSGPLIGAPVMLGWLLIALIDAMVFLRPRAVLGAGVMISLAAGVLIVGLPSGGVYANTQGDLVSILVGYLTFVWIATLAIHRATLTLVRSSDAQAFRIACSAQALETVGDVVILHNSTGAVRTASETCLKRFGVEPDQLKGNGLFDLVHVADRPAFLKAISDAVHTGLRVETALRIATYDPNSSAGRFIWVDMRTRVLRETCSDGQRAGEITVISVLRDVTLAHERSQTIEAARVEAERSNQAKDHFLATVSHELRTPLNAIIGFSEMLASDDLGPIDAGRRKEYAGIIHGSGQHLLEVVNALLDMSKIEAGRFDLVTEPFAMPLLVESTCDMVGLKALQSGVALQRDIEPGLPEIVSDRRACRQIVINLLSNAMKFTPAGGCVTVRVARVGEALAITIEDTGIGIAGEDLRRVGEPFVQVHSTYDRPFEGTGLGLSVVRGLVGLLGGTIVIESAPMAGTCVCVRLPLVQAPQSVQGQPAAIVTRLRQPVAAQRALVTAPTVSSPTQVTKIA